MPRPPKAKSAAKDPTANFAWVQYFIHHLALQGMAGIVIANGSMSSNQSGEVGFESAFSTKSSRLSQRSTA